LQIFLQDKYRLSDQFRQQQSREYYTNVRLTAIRFGSLHHAMLYLAWPAVAQRRIHRVARHGSRPCSLRSPDPLARGGLGAMMIDELNGPREDRQKTRLVTGSPRLIAIARHEASCSSMLLSETIYRTEDVIDKLYSRCLFLAAQECA
jgi:hypothetical protein